LKTIEEETE